MGSLTLTVDGRAIGRSPGSCTPGPCTVKGEWTINGGEFGAGEHTVTVTATDNAGNVEPDTFTIKVHHATPVALGPGSVNPQSGEFSLRPRTCRFRRPGAGLTVGRTYGSRHLSAGSEGPLGPQWSLSVGSEESITRSRPTVQRAANAFEGGQVDVRRQRNYFTAPNGDSNLSLSEAKNAKPRTTEYVLKDAADRRDDYFTSTTGPSATVWKATKQEGPVAARDDTLHLPDGRRGHRARRGARTGTSGRQLRQRNQRTKSRVQSARASNTRTKRLRKKANSRANGAHTKGRLKAILYYAWNITTKEIKPITVAEYCYDAKGRLRAEWNPQVSPTLRTTYGYDAEGHVTAVRPRWCRSRGCCTTGPAPRHEHGAAAIGDPARRRRAPTAVKAQDEAPPPANTKIPTLSSSEPVGGTKISVASEGTWSNAMSYSYQWERCVDRLENECNLIPGAVNQSYYPVAADEKTGTRRRW